jgi:hypothetical protein
MRRTAVIAFAAITLLSTLAAPVVVAGPGASGARAAAAPATATSVPLCPRLPGRKWCLAMQPGPTRLTTRSALAVPYGFGPADLRAAYRVPATTSTSTIAIVDAYDEPDAEANLTAYREQFGLAPCTSANGCFRKVNHGGDAAPLPAYNSGWAGEINLDLQMASAICPSCHLLLVEADDDDSSGAPNLELAVQKAAALGARFISLSWGGAEFAGQSDLDGYLAAAGVTYVAASGDNGYGTGWPAVLPNVISVGGTALYRDTSTARGWRESVWGGSYGATGSGCSLYETQPTWQAGITALRAACSARATNDVAVVADPATGVAVYVNGGWSVYGGTSAGAPIIAAMEAINGPGPGGTAAVAYPYAHAGAFNDVTSGSNGSCGNLLCQGGAGWDGPTGIGTPNGLLGLGQGASTPVPRSTVTVHSPGSVTGFAGTAANVRVPATSSQRLPIRYSATGVPPGITLRSTGYLTGVPRSAGRYRVTVTARDSSGAAAGTAFYWTVRRHRVVTSATPRVHGVLKPGHRVRATWGTFRRDTAHGAHVSVRWRIRWYVDGHAIGRATHRTFVIPRSYRGHRISFSVTATRSYYAGYTRHAHRVRVHR